MQQMHTPSTRYVWIVTSMFVVLAITFSIYAWSEMQSHRANELRLQSFQLADEPRQSSDDLTKMARTYVVTGDPRYKKYYQSILDIRDGKKPRPDGYQNIYWDLVVANEQLPKSDNGQAIALLNLMRQAGFVVDEFRRLEEAKANSDALTATEFEAMKLVETLGPEAEANRAKALIMMHDSKYHQAKAAIMKPINDFYLLMQKRTLDAVRAAETKAYNLRIVLIVVALILMFVIFRTNTVLSSIMSDTIDQVYANTQLIDRPGKINRFFFTVTIVSVAAALRLWPLHALGSMLVWLTFYPAVMLASLYGGLLSGLLATGLACLIAIFLGPLLVGSSFITRPADWLGMGVFVFTGTMISSIAEAMLRANAHAKKAQIQAETANRAKSMFLASMSHELRTPLNAILGFSSMMRKDPLLSQEQCESLDIINRSGEHLLALINDVLEMAKIEAGRLQLERAPFDLGGLMHDVTDMMHLRAQEKGLQLLTDQSSEFPRYINGDEARFRQVLINLVGNAVKFTQHGGVTVRFGLKPNAMPQRLLIEVEDSGVGINPEDQQKIFEPFVQLKQTSMQKGTGLGLTITRKFVQMMGGTINVESAPGKGAIFRVELPVEKVAAAEIAKPEYAVRGDIVGLAPNQPEYRILIVEDQLENQLLLTKLMENISFPVKVAENGEQALGLFQSWRPHLIWMDRRMPVMDGVEATRRIRELPGGKEVKIIAVTASAFMEQREELFDAGMDDFLCKPYRFNEIYECLAKQLGVQYTYAEAEVAEVVSDVVLNAQMLAALPQDLRRELQDALESLESERISVVIGCD